MLMCEAAAWMMTLLLRGEGRGRRLMAELSAAGTPRLTRNRVICHVYTFPGAAGRTAAHDQSACKSAIHQTRNGDNEDIKDIMDIKGKKGSQKTSIQIMNMYSSCSIMSLQHSFIISSSVVRAGCSGVITLLESLSFRKKKGSE